MNNIVSLLLNGVRNGNNPVQMLSNMTQNNPAVGNLMQIVQGKNPQQLEQVARNMYREAGIDIESVARQMGLK